MHGTFLHLQLDGRQGRVFGFAHEDELVAAFRPRRLDVNSLGVVVVRGREDPAQHLHLFVQPVRSGGVICNPQSC